MHVKLLGCSYKQLQGSIARQVNINLTVTSLRLTQNKGTAIVPAVSNGCSSIHPHAACTKSLEYLLVRPGVRYRHGATLEL